MKSVNTFSLGEFGTGTTTKGELFYFDLCDFDLVKNYSWHIDNIGYVRARIDGKLIRMHRLITKCPPDMVIDHINGKSTRNDNRRYNIRICLKSDNNKNSSVQGVHFEKHAHKWRSRITVNNKKIHLGYFDTKEEALISRIAAEKEYYKEFSQTR